MLDRTDRIRTYVNEYEAEPQSEETRSLGMDLYDFICFVGRSKRFILASVFTALCLAGGYHLLQPVKYTAQTQLLIEPNNVRVDRQDIQSDSPINASAVESQIAVIRSDKVIRPVVEGILSKSDKGNDPEQGIIGSFVSFITDLASQYLGKDKRVLTAGEEVELAISRVENDLIVRRVGISYVIEIEYVARDRAKASQVANAIAESYLRAQAEDRNEAIKRAEAWLEERLGNIRAEALASEAALQSFKSQAKNAESGAILLDLESSARLKRDLYENFLRRHLEISQQVSSPTSTARIISPASPPLLPTKPKSILIAGLAIFLGLGAGISGAFIAESLARSRNRKLKGTN